MRGTITANIKKNMFIILNLPEINMNSLPTEIINWKNSPSTKGAYRTLFLERNDQPSQMDQIIRKTWCKNYMEISEILVAYAITVVENLLDPKILSVEISQSRIKSRLSKTLVIFYNILSHHNVHLYIQKNYY
jgi:hypothetical protein